VHAMLASMPLDGDAATIADTSRIQARILGAPDEEAAAARDVGAAALAHPLLGRARKALRIERETAVMLRAEDGALVEGVVDLAFLEEGVGWTVVDFKTDIEIAGRKEDYARQVDAYARAIGAATCRSEPNERKLRWTAPSIFRNALQMQNGSLRAAVVQVAAALVLVAGRACRLPSSTSARDTTLAYANPPRTRR
jgi:hypothetical protein